MFNLVASIKILLFEIRTPVITLRVARPNVIRAPNASNNEIPSIDNDSVIPKVT